MKKEELEETDILYADLEKRLDSMKGKRRKYVLFHKLNKVIMIGAGAAITVITGWNFDDCCIWLYGLTPNNIVLVTSALITLLAAMEGLFNFKDKAMLYEVLVFDLRKLRNDIVYDADKGLYPGNRDEYYVRYKDILESKKDVIEESYSGTD